MALFVNDSVIVEDEKYNETMQALEAAYEDFQKKRKDAILLPEKYMATLRIVVAQDVHKIHEQTPEKPLTKVVSTILEGLNEKISADMVLEIVPFIVEKWQAKTEQAATKEADLATARI
jgi:hypothetical protein